MTILTQKLNHFLLTFGILNFIFIILNEYSAAGMQCCRKSPVVSEEENNEDEKINKKEEHQGEWKGRIRVFLRGTCLFLKTRAF